MEKSTVYISMKENNNLECSFAIIQKKEKSVILIFKDLECVIYDYENFQKSNFDYKYLLLKHYDNQTSAYKDFMKLIGKMCKKNESSKYFKNHIDEDNHIIFYDDQNEHSAIGIHEEEYLTRKNLLETFLQSNKEKFLTLYKKNTYDQLSS